MWMPFIHWLIYSKNLSRMPLYSRHCVVGMDNSLSSSLRRAVLFIAHSSDHDPRRFSLNKENHTSLQAQPASCRCSNTALVHPCAQILSSTLAKFINIFYPSAEITLEANKHILTGFQTRPPKTWPLGILKILKTEEFEKTAQARWSLWPYSTHFASEIGHMILVWAVPSLYPERRSIFLLKAKGCQEENKQAELAKFPHALLCGMSAGPSSKPAYHPHACFRGPHFM